MWRIPLALGVVVVAAVAAAEVATWRVSRRSPALRRAGRCAVIVLGYPSTRAGGLHPIQKWRTQIGVRTLAEVDDGWLILSGGPTRGAKESEAAVMARYAVALGVPRERIVLEEEARSTWDNVLYCLPLAEAGGAEQIAIASDPMHVDKARRYVAVQRPDLAVRVVRAADYRVLERWWLKVASAAYYLLLRARGNFGSPPPGFEREGVS
jgi:uncharacterized SAM-binding protein YcdF (DUF218 family)